MPESNVQPIKKLLVANRGEIAIRIFRAATELGITTVALYTHEDRYSLHRFKADEAYPIGSEDEPLRPYLDIEAILKLAKAVGVDAIHPGYGFLSENVQLARRCQQEGIIFVGPRPEVMEALGDKVRAKEVAKNAGIPLIEDSQVDLSDVGLALSEARRIGFPVIIKAAAGGGGRGMRVVRSEQDLSQAFDDARSEAGKAFGDATLFLEKFIENPKHIEVQLMGDNYGTIVHLYERDCSVQRRFQKVVEVAPAPSLRTETRQAIHQYALQIARQVGYNNVGTAEFLVDADENIYFIEVNPRIQVEHTITEEITRVDIVRSQILIAAGHRLEHPSIFIRSQDDIKPSGFAIQCRITTEDPENGFRPDFGTIIAYRHATGFGIRIDEGSSYAGVRVSPFFDSMLVKVSATGRTLRGACQRMQRALKEFRIRGVKTNIGFLENVIADPTFQKGEATVGFIEGNPQLFAVPKRLDRGTRILRYLGEVAVNGHPDVPKGLVRREFRHPSLSALPQEERAGTTARQILLAEGPEGLARWVKGQSTVLFTDTTLRDAHQSLLATRVRTTDMVAVTQAYARHLPEVFSLECWGGATFDVALRFLHEDPWDRLRLLRQAAPNTLLQMLLRASNAVGYKAYPDLLVQKFIVKAWEQGIDVFRIFDSLNWLPELELSIRTIRQETGALAEAAICYTGDILDPARSKYNKEYYISLAQRLEDMGAHILCIKDMAGLLKPYAAAELVSALKEKVQIPIHLHTHDTSSMQSATLLKAIETGVDIVDVAIASLSGLTSQPNFNALVAALQHTPQASSLPLASLNAFARYWEDVREYYYPFESELRAGTAEVYEHEIPGGQYSNLRPQARSLGLEDRFELVKHNFAVANRLFGDIIKVTPSSKIVGDFALFMTANGLSEQDIFDKGETLSFPESVKEFFRGEIGLPEGGFPARLQALVLKGEKPISGRPNSLLPPLDWEAEYQAFCVRFPEFADETHFLSYKLYPKVFEEFAAFQGRFGEVWQIPTPEFFYPMNDGAEISVTLGPGKTILIRKLGASSQVDENGFRVVSFEMNGQVRRVRVRDQAHKVVKESHRKSEGIDTHIAAPLQGKLSQLYVKEGDTLQKGQALFTIEAMKMETTVSATRDGVVKTVVLKPGTLVESEDLVLILA